MPIWPFRPSRADLDAMRLLEAVQAASRRPAFFGDSRIPDTLEGRFELMALNGALMLIRLKSEPGAAPLAQAFTDGMFSSFDAGLREAGIGDLSVPKQMRKLAGAFYGRLNAYAEALGQNGEAALAAAIGRNVFAFEAHPFAGAIAQNAVDTLRAQADLSLERLLDGEGWPPPSA
jgi:cytochrome b pre-mRNA-processing protein 3